MQLAAIIGHPVAHSMSPAIYNAVFPAMGIDARYEAWDTPPEAVSAAIARVRNEAMLGLSVTVPYKETVMPLLDALAPEAEAIGAVNCIVQEAGRLTGHNTDAYGFIRSLLEAGCEPRGLRCVVLGAGGSAKAVGYALATAEAKQVALAGRRSEAVAATATRLRTTAPKAVEVAALRWGDEAFTRACGEAELIVNCTPIGMAHTQSEGESPLPQALLRGGVWVTDLVYNPLETLLLRQARAAGAKPVGGLEMLIYQAVQSVRLWTGREPPIDIMRNAVREAMGARA